MSSDIDSPKTTIAEPSSQEIFAQKSEHAIELFGQALENAGLNLAFCVIYDVENNNEPKVFYRGDMVNVTKHTSRVLNMMRHKIINELNGNF